jgi:hypothetical protein
MTSICNNYLFIIQIIIFKIYYFILLMYENMNLKDKLLDKNESFEESYKDKIVKLTIPNQIETPKAKKKRENTNLVVSVKYNFIFKRTEDYQVTILSHIKPNFKGEEIL